MSLPAATATAAATEPTDNQRTRTAADDKRRKRVCKIIFPIMATIGLVVIIMVIVLVPPKGQGAPLTPPQALHKVQPSFPASEWVAIEVPEDLSSKPPFDHLEYLLVPKGFGIQAYSSVPLARFLLALPDGNVLVSQPGPGKISLLRPPKAANVSAERLEFAVGLRRPHDMVLHLDNDVGGGYLYIAESHQVARYPYKKGDTRIGKAEVLVEGLPTYTGFRHPLKNIAIGNNTLYVSIGSGTNADPKDLKVDPKRGAIYGYNLDGTERRLVSEGVRNAEGLAFAPGTDQLWVVVNQRDEIKYPYKDKTGHYGKVIAEYVDENPPEEFTQIIEGQNYGWPYCNPVPSESMDNLDYVADVDTNPNESVVKCSTFRRVDKGMEAHSAPLGLSFWEGKRVAAPFKGGALVAMHGSWNRRSFSGHKIVFYPWVNGRPGHPFDLVSGWVLDADKKERWGRPVDTAVLQDGSFLISDDFSGGIYRFYKK